MARQTKRERDALGIISGWYEKGARFENTESPPSEMVFRLAIAEDRQTMVLGLFAVNEGNLDLVGELELDTPDAETLAVALLVKARSGEDFVGEDREQVAERGLRIPAGLPLWHRERDS